MRAALAIAAALLAAAAPAAPRGRVFGGFDLGPGRAVWAIGRPSGFQRIRLQRL